MTDETNAPAEASGDKAYVFEGQDFNTDLNATAPQPVEETPAPGDDAAAAPEGEAQGDQPGRRQTAQERIDEVTKLRRDAERDRDYWRELALRNGENPPEPARPEPKPPAGDGRPDPDVYENGVTDPAYIEDLTTWKAEKAVDTRLAKDAETRKQEAARQTFHDRERAFAEKAPDYREVVQEGAKRGDWSCSKTMAQAMGSSEQGPAVAYHLAKNPAEADRIAALPDIDQAREIGRLEARLSAPEQQPAKTATEAPEPPPRARGAGGHFKVAADTDDFAAFDKQYG